MRAFFEQTEFLNVLLCIEEIIRNSFKDVYEKKVAYYLVTLYRYNIDSIRIAVARGRCFIESKKTVKNMNK
jgi:hypothetical protein